jgi:hypothetical protein
MAAGPDTRQAGADDQHIKVFSDRGTHAYQSAYKAPEAAGEAVRSVVQYVLRDCDQIPRADVRSGRSDNM